MIAQNSTRTTDSTDRIIILSATNSLNSVVAPKTKAARFSGTTRRILNSLMRSLASPHI
jgi:hypothetical protein